jgi:hypothetical protein
VSVRKETGGVGVRGAHPSKTATNGAASVAALQCRAKAAFSVKTLNLTFSLYPIDPAQEIKFIKFPVHPTEFDILNI